MHLLQSIIIFPRYQNVQDMSFILTSHPALHNFTTEIKECDASTGMIWAILACGGSCGRGRGPKLLELMWTPSGNFTRIGTTASSFFEPGYWRGENDWILLSPLWPNFGDSLWSVGPSSESSTVCHRSLCLKFRKLKRCTYCEPKIGHYWNWGRGSKSGCNC